MSTVLLFLIAVHLSPRVARAYIPPAQFVVKVMVGKKSSAFDLKGGVKGIRIKSSVVALENGQTHGPLLKAVTFYNPQSRILRSQISDETDHILYAIERKDHSPILDTLLFDPLVARVTEELRELKIPIKTEKELLALANEDERRQVEVSSISRWKKTITWVLGRKNKPESQLWVEKDTFLPLRVIYYPKGESDPIEIEMENYRFHREFPFPHLITVTRKKMASLKEEVGDVSVGPELPELKSPAHPWQGYTEAGNAAPSATRELIRQYYETNR